MKLGQLCSLFSIAAWTSACSPSAPPGPAQSTTGSIETAADGMGAAAVLAPNASRNTDRLFVTGKLTFEPDLRASDFEVSLTSSQDPEVHRYAARHGVAEDGSFKVIAHPGSRHVNIWPASQALRWLGHEPLFVVADALDPDVVQRGAVDVGSLDLRGHLVAHLIHTVDEEGNELFAPQFEIEQEGRFATQFFAGRGDRPGPHRVVAPAGPHKIRVLVEDRRSTLVPIDQQEPRVVLRMGIPVRIRITNLPAEFDKDETLLLHFLLPDIDFRLRTGGSSSRWTRQDQGLENGEQLVFLPTPGSYELRLQYLKFHRFATSSAQGYTTYHGSAPEDFEEILQIEDDTSEQLFEFTLSEAAIKSLLVEARAR